METKRYAQISEAQVMDIYCQEGKERSPLMIVVHGGAFLVCDQKMATIKPVIEAAYNQGYVVASVDYRKSTEAIFPAALADVKASVRYLRAHAQEYGIDTTKIVIWGESAGGYLSLMTALTPEVEELNGDVPDYPDYSSNVTALATFYPVVEMYTMKAEYESWGDYEHGDGGFTSAFLGVEDIYQDKPAADRSYWETYKDQLPEDFALDVWIQVGDTSDTLVPYKQSENLAQRLSEVNGVRVYYEQFPGAEHIDPVFYTDDNLLKLINWVNRVLER